MARQANFYIPNDDDADFGDQAEPDSRDFDWLAAGLMLRGVRSGGAVTPQGSPDMTVDVALGEGSWDGVDFAWSASDNLAIGAADATNPRFDLIVVSTAGTVSVVAGTAAASPVFPDPGSDVVLAAVYVPATETAIEAANIIDKRVMVTGLMKDGAAGGQTLTGGTGSGDKLGLISSAHSTKGGITFEGDDNFNVSIVSSNPRLTFDSGDYLYYDRANDRINLAAGGTDHLRIAASGSQTTVITRLGTGAEQLLNIEFAITTENAQIRLYRNTNTTGRVVFGVYKGDNTTNTIFFAQKDADADGGTIRAATAGYFRVGSMSTPANTTAGDITGVRLSLANNTFSATAGYFIQGGGDMTDTSNGAKIAYSFNPSMSPASNSLSDFRVLNMSGLLTPATGVTMDTVVTHWVEVDNRSDSTISATAGIQINAMTLRSTNTVRGLVGTVAGMQISAYQRPSGTGTISVTNMTGLVVDGPTSAGATVTTYRGVHITNPGANFTPTNLVFIDLEAPTRGGTLNFAIRNAGNSVQTGYARFGAVTAPTNVTDGDITFIRGFVNDDSNFKIAFESSTPRITVDSGDYMEYDRTNNRFVFESGGKDSYVVKRARTVQPKPVGRDGGTVDVVLGTTTTAWAIAVMVNAAIEIVRLTYFVPVAATGAGQVIRWALYSEDGQTKYFDVTDAIGTNSGKRTVAVSNVFIEPGTYYLFVCSQTNAATTNSTVRFVSINNEFNNSGSTNNDYVEFGTLVITAGAAPATINPLEGGDITVTSDRGPAYVRFSGAAI